MKYFPILRFELKKLFLILSSSQNIAYQIGICVSLIDHKQLVIASAKSERLSAAKI